jgi:hypothetical protein
MELLLLDYSLLLAISVVCHFRRRCDHVRRQGGDEFWAGSGRLIRSSVLMLGRGHGCDGICLGFLLILGLKFRLVSIL